MHAKSFICSTVFLQTDALVRNEMQAKSFVCSIVFLQAYDTLVRNEMHANRFRGFSFRFAQWLCTQHRLYDS